MAQKPLQDGLFDWPSADPRLIAGRHRETGEIVFPAPDNDEVWERIRLGTSGRLWTYTVQRFAPPSPPYHRQETPESFTPFAVGYIELPGEVRIEARLTGVDVDSIEIGAEYELTFDTLCQDEAGDDIIAFFFRPVGAAREAA